LKINGNLDPAPGNDILRGATVAIGYEPIVNPHSPHNGQADHRAQNLARLITTLWLVEIGFQTNDKVGKPISHFIHTNNPAHRESLKTLDLLNALVHRIKDNPYHPSPHPQNVSQTNISNHWDDIWDRLYKEVDKDPGVAEDFFYNWMIASMRWNGDERWKKSELYPGLQAHWRDSGNLYRNDGNYDLDYLEAEFREMDAYSKIYIEGIMPENIAVGNTRKNLHKKLLFISNKMDKQWMPAYLAIRYLANEMGASETSTLDAINGFLTSMVTLNLKFRHYPRMIKKNWGGAGASPHEDSYVRAQEIHGCMDGRAPGKWIKLIHDSITGGNLTAATISAISTLPKDVVPATTIPEWSVGDPHRKYVNGGGQGMSGFLWAFETALSGNNPPSGFEEAEIEHILPKVPSKWVGGVFAPPDKWFSGGRATDLHKQFVEMLGNKALIKKQLNSHVRNFTFQGKKLNGGPVNPDCDIQGCTNHYDSAATFPSISSAHPLGVSGYTNWDEAEITSRTEEMMDKIISMFDTI